MSKKPPLPQNRDRRVFREGSRVSAYLRFSPSCPPTDEIIPKGALGTVSGSAKEEFDGIFGTKIRMIPVKWDDGRTCTVIDRLLVLEDT